MTTLNAYAAEISPKIRKLNEMNDALKEWKATDEDAQRFLDDIKETRERLKDYIEESESNLLREINDLKTDIKLAVAAAVDGTEYDAKDFRAYLVARANEKVSDVVEKGTLFAALDEVLS